MLYLHVIPWKQLYVFSPLVINYSLTIIGKVNQMFDREEFPRNEYHPNDYQAILETHK